MHLASPLSPMGKLVDAAIAAVAAMSEVLSLFRGRPELARRTRPDTGILQTNPIEILLMESEMVFRKTRPSLSHYSAVRERSQCESKRPHTIARRISRIHEVHCVRQGYGNQSYDHHIRIY
jgi:hypothetical protein